MESQVWSNEEYIITTLGRGITDMKAATATKNENNFSQKDYGGSPLGGMADMAVSAMPTVMQGFK